ncbi:MAG: T9SS C-terminal target domain-containing protein [Ignavibacteriales bacterium]|nr:T9SS C-terminal target domain-containing protein [Ignavibacteriales bacterium]
MKKLKLILIFTIVSVSVIFAQQRKYEVHSRGMLHQTVFNTGELGRAFDAGSTGIAGGYPPSMEWPPNGHMFVDRKEYEGQHNSMGGGVYIGATRNGERLFAFCGAVSTSNGGTTPVEGVYSNPISIERRINFPVLSNGAINLSYNPDEAEEIIISKWGTPTGITVRRTSRAWSFPGYNGFIIYEYEFENTTTDTLKDAFIAWTYAFAPSMFGYQRKFNRWGEGDYRNNAFGRFDLKRYMSYNHEREGRPDSVLFDIWSNENDRGGLNSPQAVGMMVLHYDYDHLAVKGKTNLYVTPDDEKYVWDINNKIKQPYLLRFENANLYYTKITQWLDYQARKTGPFKGKNDSLNFPDDNYYWIGRVKSSYKLAYTQPVCRGYGFGPYTLAPGEIAKFSIAEVVGYGPGRASDSVYRDLGGSTLGSSETGSGMHPVPSWYKTISYPEIQNPGTMGSNYLQTHPLPWYVDPEVVSIRDAADRAIQMYLGGPLVKYDTVQFEPKTTPEKGRYLVSIPIPAPNIRIENTSAASNRIIWGPQVETFTTGRLNAPFSHYLVMRALHPLGPWTRIDSVGKRDLRYFRDSIYSVLDYASDLGVDVYYAVYSVDATGKKSGFTNMTAHTTQSPAAPVLEKVYVVPNPLVVTNGRTGSAVGGDVSDQIGFFGLTKKCTIKIFSFSGQLIQTIEHDGDGYSEVSWFQISRNHQMIASGVYFFTVEDAATGKRAKGKFVIIH